MHILIFTTLKITKEMENPDRPSRLLDEALKPGEIRREPDVKIEEEKNIKEILSQYILDYSECKWYQFIRKRYLERKIKTIQTEKDESVLTYGLSNLKNDTTEVLLSGRYYMSETTDVRSMMYDLRDELAIELVSRGYITFEQIVSKLDGNDIITVKAIINVKKK